VSEFACSSSGQRWIHIHSCAGHRIRVTLRIHSDTGTAAVRTSMELSSTRGGARFIHRAAHSRVVHPSTAAAMLFPSSPQQINPTAPVAERSSEEARRDVGSVRPPSQPTHATRQRHPSAPSSPRTRVSLPLCAAPSQPQPACVCLFWPLCLGAISLRPPGPQRRAREVEGTRGGDTAEERDRHTHVCGLAWLLAW
jgi:hypothetical protein